MSKTRPQVPGTTEHRIQTMLHDMMFSVSTIKSIFKQQNCHIFIILILKKN